MTYQDALEKLQVIYDMVPPVACQGLCHGYCGPLAVSHLERVRLLRQTGRKLRETQQYACPLLKQGRCAAYALRPLICRAFGVVESMACPYGCAPERYLTVSEFQALCRAVEEVSQSVFPKHGTESFHAARTLVQVQEDGAAQLDQALGAWL